MEKVHAAGKPAKEKSKQHTTFHIMPTAKTTLKPTIYCLRIELLDIVPPIWRSIEIPGDIKLPDLGYPLLAVMGWDFYDHSHMFHVRRERYGPYSPFDSTSDADEDRHPTLAQIAPRRGSSFLVLYDFGDRWMHRVTVEARTEHIPNTAYPRCIAGANACPPDDCGGWPSYQRILDCFNDSTKQRSSWISTDFDPSAFDLAATNSRITPATYISVSPPKKTRRSIRSSDKTHETRITSPSAPSVHARSSAITQTFRA